MRKLAGNSMDEIKPFGEFRALGKLPNGSKGK